MAEVKRTYKTKSGKTVKEYKNGDKEYVGYDKGDGRKINVTRKADGSYETQHTAKRNKNAALKKAGKKPIPKQPPGKGKHVAHKPGTKKSDSSASSTTVQSARKNQGDNARENNPKRRRS